MVRFWKKKQHIISEQGSSSRSYRQKTHNKRMLLYQKNFCVNPKFTSKVNSMDINLSLCFLWINNFIIITFWNYIRERRQEDFKVIRWFLEILIYYIVVVCEKSSKTSFKQTKKAHMWSIKFNEALGNILWPSIYKKHLNFSLNLKRFKL